MRQTNRYSFISLLCLKCKMLFSSQSRNCEVHLFLELLNFKHVHPLEQHLGRKIPKQFNQQARLCVLIDLFLTNSVIRLVNWMLLERKEVKYNVILNYYLSNKYLRVDFGLFVTPSPLNDLINRLQ